MTKENLQAQIEHFETLLGKKSEMSEDARNAVNWKSIDRFLLKAKKVLARGE